MKQTIRIGMLGDERIMHLSEGVLTQSTVKNAFLLPPNAIIALSYNDNGQTVFCMANESGTCFLLPEGWQFMQFFVESDKLPFHSVTPADQVLNNGPIYVPIKVDDLVLQLGRYLFFEKIGNIKHCFTVILTHYAVTFNHGPHQNWLSSPIENQTALTICNQAGQNFETRLVECDAEVDFVVVHSDVPLVSNPPAIGLPNKLERYILLGYPNLDSNYQALEGIFFFYRTR